MIRLGTGMALIALIAGGLMGNAAADEEPLTGGLQKISDAEFVRKASMINLMEIRVGKIAAMNAQREDVKDYGRKLLSEHALNYQFLQSLANKKGYQVSEVLDHKHMLMATKLSQYRGEDFDRHFLQDMIQGHRAAIDLFTAQARQGVDPELKAFARVTLKKLKQHLQSARQLNGDKDTTESAEEAPNNGTRKLER
jgi:putative membrane protein